MIFAASFEDEVKEEESIISCAIEASNMDCPMMINK